MSPLVLVPAGPLGWASYQDIYPALERVWSKAGFEIQPIWYPRPRLDSDLVQRCKDSPRLIFPLGISHTEALWTLGELRGRHGCQTAATVMVASDFTAGFRTLVESFNLLTPNDSFVTNCTVERELLLMAFGKQANVHSIPLPLPAPKPSRVNMNRSRLRRELGIGHDEKVILYSGRISVQKNIHGLIACVKRMLPDFPTLRLIVAGAADEIGFPRLKNQNKHRYIHELSTLVTSLHLEERVTFVGHLSQENLAAYMAASDVHASLSLHSGEDFGYSIAQGLVLDRPSVITRWGGGHDFVDHCGALGVKVHVTGNGPKISFSDAVTQLSKACHSSGYRSANRSRVKYLSDSEIVKKWRRAVRKSKLRDHRLRLNEGFKKLRMARAAHFASAVDPLYLSITRIFAQSARPKKTRRYEWHPLFDINEMSLKDPISARRDLKLTRIDVAFIRGRAQGAVSTEGMSTADRSVTYKLASFGVLLPLVN
jgi:glycosyltransferase involved in cell wall biosynthesis